MDSNVIEAEEEQKPESPRPSNTNAADQSSSQLADSSAIQPCVASRSCGHDNKERKRLDGDDRYNHDEEKAIAPTVNDDYEEDFVLDVSPTGYSLTSLDSLLKQDSEKRLCAKNMYVFDNTFTILPTSVGKLKNLRKLKIFSNEVRLLPDEMGEISQLEHLQMKVRPSGLGALPPLSSLVSLRTLELQQTPLRPSVLSIPPEISNLRLLTRLAICNFSISFLPPEISALKSLQELDLSFNKLKSLPDEICSLMALKHLRADNNKLIELPSGLASLPNLCSIEVAHNKLTSLDSLGLFNMTSLKTLNVKFNKLQRLYQVPDWINCNLEGNPFSPSSILTSSSGEDGLEDSEVLPLATESNEVTCQTLVAVNPKDVMIQKNGVHGRRKHGWKRRDSQQLLQARQDRLNLSRKSKIDFVKGSENGVAKMLPINESNCYSPKSSGSVANRYCLENESTAQEKECIQYVDYDEQSTTGRNKNSENSLAMDQRESPTEDSAPKLENHNDRRGFDSNSCGKVISGDRSNECRDPSLVERDEEESQNFIFKVKECEVNKGRRKGLPFDRNPKPKKRRKSTQLLSESSLRYRMQSICGFDVHLEDGFYDAGREHPFTSLEDLECEEPCLDSREVILVDRDRDEELDVISLSAQHLLSRLEFSGQNIGNAEQFQLNNLQKAMVLALFVSDCFGGSDKMLNIAKTRRAALGSFRDVPFLCSCSTRSSIAATSDAVTGNFQGVIPTVHMLSEVAVKLLKVRRQSNVIPLGGLSYGVCRHRAILFKYLCDRACIPCELVRGYLDYVPHAWNVIMVDQGGRELQMLVDACRPLDVREERESEYFCRYIPLKRLLLPHADGKTLAVVQSDDIIPEFHEEIGRGASGSVVRRCSLGSLTAAAKIHIFNMPSTMLYEDVLSRFLSEVRILCSLEQHPHIISFYGHELKNEAEEKQATQAAQLTIYMEYVHGYSLQAVLDEYVTDGRTYMPLREAALVAKAIAHALSYVHSRGIVYRDVKSSNVLVNLKSDNSSNGEDGQMPLIKLCDFGSAVPLLSSSVHMCYVAHRGIPSAEVCVGTPRWMAPEVFRAMYNQQPYGLEADMWSFGCLLLEMLTLNVPYAKNSENEIHTLLQAGQRPELPVRLEDLVLTMSSDDEIEKESTISAEDLKILKVLVSLYKSCTESEPANRPTALEIYRTLSDALESTNFDVNDSPISSISKAGCTLGAVKTACSSNEKSKMNENSKQSDKQESQARENRAL